LYKTCS